MNIFRLAAVFLALLGGIAKADPIGVDFSFNGTQGNAPGLVTGELVFDSAGIDVAATHIYIFTGPDGTLSAAQANVDYAPFSFNNSNAFTVSAEGLVTAANLAINNAQGDSQLLLNAAGSGQATYLYNYDTLLYSYSSDGFSGITFTPVAATTVPEPASLIVVGGGMLTLGLIRRLRKPRKTPASIPV